MAGSGQTQSCLIPHPGSEQRQEPESASMESPLACEHVARRAAQEVIQDKPSPHHLPFSLYFAGVMQDKGIPNFVERICTTPLSPPITCWRDMYFIYIFLWQYMASMHMHLVY